MCEIGLYPQKQETLRDQVNRNTALHFVGQKLLRSKSGQVLSQPVPSTRGGGLTEILVKMYSTRDRTDRSTWIRWPPNRFRRYSGIVTTCTDGRVVTASLGDQKAQSKQSRAPLWSEESERCPHVPVLQPFAHLNSTLPSNLSQDIVCAQ